MGSECSFDSYEDYLAAGYPPIERYEKAHELDTGWRRSDQTSTIVCRIPCRPDEAHEKAVQIKSALAPFGLRPKFEKEDEGNPTPYRRY